MAETYNTQNQLAANYLGPQTPEAKMVQGPQLAAGQQAYYAPPQTLGGQTPAVSAYAELQRYADAPARGRATGVIGAANRLAGQEGETPLVWAIRRSQGGNG